MFDKPPSVSYFSNKYPSKYVQSIYIQRTPISITKKKKKNFPHDSRNRPTILATFSIIHMLTHSPSSGPRNSLISNSHSNTSHNTSISDAYNSLSYANAIFSPLHCQVSRFTPAKAARCPMTRIIKHAWCETVGGGVHVLLHDATLDSISR